MCLQRLIIIINHITIFLKSLYKIKFCQRSTVFMRKSFDHKLHKFFRKTMFMLYITFLQSTLNKMYHIFVSNCSANIYK